MNGCWLFDIRGVAVVKGGAEESDDERGLFAMFDRLTQSFILFDRLLNRGLRFNKLVAVPTEIGQLDALQFL